VRVFTWSLLEWIGLFLRLVVRVNSWGWKLKSDMGFTYRVWVSIALGSAALLVLWMFLNAVDRALIHRQELVVVSFIACSWRLCYHVEWCCYLLAGDDLSRVCWLTFLSSYGLLLYEDGLRPFMNFYLGGSGGSLRKKSLLVRRLWGGSVHLGMKLKSLGGLLHLETLLGHSTRWLTWSWCRFLIITQCCL
jgi:hypothetical protein